MEGHEHYRLSDVFLLAQRIEKNGYAFYADLASTTMNSSLKKVFTFLAKEESEHIELFKELYHTCRAEMTESGTAIGENIFQLDNIASRHVFLRSDFEVVRRNIKTIIDAVNYALVFEEDTIKFFRQLLGAVEPGHQEIIRALIKKEEGHKETLRKLLADPSLANQ